MIEASVSANSAAQSAAREIKHVVDQADIRATLFCINPRISPAGSFWSSFVSILVPAAIEASGLRRSWPSTAMKLLAQFRSLALAQQSRLGDGQPIGRLEMGRNQFRKQLEHADRLRCVQTRRPGIDRAQGAEECPSERMMGIEI